MGPRRSDRMRNAKCKVISAFGTTDLRFAIADLRLKRRSCNAVQSQIANRKSKIPVRLPRAFTMVETVICVVIVAGMMVAALEMLGTSARLRGLQTDQSRAAALARDLLSEIMQYNYQDPTLPTVVLGPEVGETRASFDDVDDYNGLNESPPQTAKGAAIAGYTGWTRSVQVLWAD